MSSTACTNCGQKIAIPEDHTRPKIRCSMCGYYTVLANQASKDAAKAEKNNFPDIGTDRKPAEKTISVNDEQPKASRRAKPISASPSPTQKQTRPITTQKKSQSTGYSEVNESAPDKDQHARKAKSKVDPLDHRPDFHSLDPKGPNLLEGDHTEHDAVEETTPYAVPGTGVKKCPECRGELPIDATFCVSCGVELTSKVKANKREFTPLNRSWESILTFNVRMKIFIGLILFNLFLILITAVFSEKENVYYSIVNIFVQTPLEAFLLGSYTRLQITRTPKGKSEVIRNLRLCFIPIKPEKINWKVSHGTGIVGGQFSGPFEWGTMIYLLFFAIVPGILFYWYVIRPDRFDIVLTDVHGSTDSTIFTTTDRELAVDICTILSESTGLSYYKVV